MRHGTSTKACVNSSYSVCYDYICTVASTPMKTQPQFRPNGFIRTSSILWRQVQYNICLSNKIVDTDRPTDSHSLGFQRRDVHSYGNDDKHDSDDNKYTFPCTDTFIVYRWSMDPRSSFIYLYRAIRRMWCVHCRKLSCAKVSF
jgi:hypothetical protein